MLFPACPAPPAPGRRARPVPPPDVRSEPWSGSRSTCVPLFRSSSASFIPRCSPSTLPSRRGGSWGPEDSGHPSGLGVVASLCSQTSAWGATRSSCGQSEGRAVRPLHRGRGRWNASQAPRGWRVEGQPLRLAWSAPPAPPRAVPSPVGPQHPLLALARAGLSASDTFSASAHPSLSSNLGAQFKYGFLSGALPYPAALHAGQFSGRLHMLALLPQNSHPARAPWRVCCPVASQSCLGPPPQHPGRGSLPPVMPGRIDPGRCGWGVTSSLCGVWLTHL